MKTQGSARIETPNEANYSYVDKLPDSNLHRFKNLDTDIIEVFAQHKEPVAGWQMELFGKYYEFCYSEPI